MTENSKPTKLDLRIMEHKLSTEQSLTPEQLQAQQDAYDQWTAPSVEPVDFEAERNAYLDRRQIREEIVDDGSIRMTNVVVGEDSDGNFTVTGEIEGDIPDYGPPSFSL